MTPAINLLKKLKIFHAIHEYHHDPKSESYGLEAAEKMGVPPEQVFKTLVVQNSTHELFVAILPVCTTLSMKLLAKASGSKKVDMADKHLVEKTTGYVLGGVSPLGQKKRLKTFIDSSATQFDTIYISAGKRGLEISLKPTDLQQCLQAHFVDISVAD
jgi:Cys-tRNA(Pro)/Cys-tRNA(Cys) deacylase